MEVCSGLHVATMPAQLEGSLHLVDVDLAHLDWHLQAHMIFELRATAGLFSGTISPRRQSAHRRHSAHRRKHYSSLRVAGDLLNSKRMPG